MEYIILIIPILLSMPHVLDTYFFKYRIYGYKIIKTDYGYSLHIRYSTLARGFYFLGLPIVGLIFNIVSNSCNKVNKSFRAFPPLDIIGNALERFKSSNA